MGAKRTIPYGLYVGVRPLQRAARRPTGSPARTWTILWRAFTLMFEHDRASTRGEMTLRGLYVFTHADEFGSRPRPGPVRPRHGHAPQPAAARALPDYQVSLPEDSDLPAESYSPPCRGMSTTSTLRPGRALA